MGLTEQSQRLRDQRDRQKPQIIGICLGCWGEPESCYMPDYMPRQQVVCGCERAGNRWPNFRTYSKRRAWICLDCSKYDEYAFTNRQEFLEHEHYDD